MDHKIQNNTEGYQKSLNKQKLEKQQSGQQDENFKSQQIKHRDKKTKTHKNNDFSSDNDDQDQRIKHRNKHKINEINENSDNESDIDSSPKRNRSRNRSRSRDGEKKPTYPNKQNLNKENKNTKADNLKQNQNKPNLLNLDTDFLQNNTSIHNEGNNLQQQTYNELNEQQLKEQRTIQKHLELEKIKGNKIDVHKEYNKYLERLKENLAKNKEKSNTDQERKKLQEYFNNEKTELRSLFINKLNDYEKREKELMDESNSSENISSSNQESDESPEQYGSSNYSSNSTEKL
ncbi:MAG: hypothetical protein N4A49_15275 [Marinifilaceae bacterium]|jgi:hypothetical protein|nr:hypothetical protein [Marinifilaceae bacterium]